jgi:hypothetical protein
MAHDLFNLDDNAKINDLKRLTRVLNAALISKIRGHTQILAALTPFTRISALKQSLVSKGYSIKSEWGKLLMVEKANEVPFYVMLNKDTVAYFITLARKTEDVPATVLSYISSAKELTLIRTGTRRLRTLREELQDSYPGIQITYFTAHRDPHTPSKSAYRADHHRTIIYSGEDGLDTLEEMEYHYGIIPKIMEFHAPRIFRFRLDVSGIYTLMEGRADPLINLLKGVVERTLDSSLSSALGRSHAGITQVIVGTSSRSLNRAILQHMEEALSIDCGISSFMQVMESRRGLYYTQLVDVEDLARWELVKSGEDMRIIPGEGSNMRSLLKLIEVLEDHLSFTVIDIESSKDLGESNLNARVGLSDIGSNVVEEQDSSDGSISTDPKPGNGNDAEVGT